MICYILSLHQPTIHDKPPSEPQPYFFQDLPYTEWISQRWTYQDAPFADWPTLPDEIDDIQQLVAGKLGGSSGLWLLTDSQLFFVRGLHGGSPEAVEFLNVSQQLDLDVTVDSYVASKFDSYLYLISSYNITYLDCSLQELVHNNNNNNNNIKYSEAVWSPPGTHSIGC